MNKAQEKTWKKLAKKDLILGPRLSGYNMCAEAQEMLNELKDRLDDSFTVFDVRTTIHPATFEPHVSIVLNKTEKK